MTATTWELTYRTSATGDERKSMHDTRDEALSRLADYLLDDGVTYRTDPDFSDRNNGVGDYRAELLTNIGVRIRYSLREVTVAAEYLSLAQVAERIGVLPGSVSRYKLPPPDVIVGPVNSDGSLPRGTVRGWLPDTIDKWNAARPGRGARTDLEL